MAIRMRRMEAVLIANGKTYNSTMFIGQDSTEPNLYLWKNDDGSVGGHLGMAYESENSGIYMDPIEMNSIIIEATGYQGLNFPVVNPYHSSYGTMIYQAFAGPLPVSKNVSTDYVTQGTKNGVQYQVRIRENIMMGLMP